MRDADLLDKLLLDGVGAFAVEVDAPIGLPVQPGHLPHEWRFEELEEGEVAKGGGALGRVEVVVLAGNWKIYFFRFFWIFRISFVFKDFLGFLEFQFIEILRLLIFL